MATDLRGAGVSVDLDLEGGRIGKQMKAADARGCRFALIQGPDEKQSGAVVIKEMASGAQHTVPEAEAAETVARLLEGA
jgi:histidyl-tRNA synthetase